jgi:parvulin-like peptidyl-prolyl isomerase
MEESLKRVFLAGLAGILITPVIGQTDPSAVVLTVNGDVIKAADYYHRLEILPGVSKRIGNATLTYPPGFLTLEALITERLVFQLAKQKNVMPTEPEVQAELNSILTENPNFLNEAELAGQSKADVFHQLKYQMAQFKISTLGVTITDAEIDKFYRERPNLFTIPKRAKLSVIAVSDEATKSKVDAELESGKSFADVAKAYSEDISKDSGGEFGTLSLLELPEQVRNEINKTKIGQKTSWVLMGAKDQPTPPKTQAKFLLHDVLPEKLTPLDAKVRKQLRRKLMLDRGAAKNDVSREMQEMRLKAKIDITNKTFAEMYKRYLQELGRVPATTGGG